MQKFSLQARETQHSVYQNMTTTLSDKCFSIEDSSLLVDMHVV